MEKFMRFNFDRRKSPHGRPMAEGIGVHAHDLMSAFTLAGMMKDADDVITFRDNTPCVSQCKYCHPQEGRDNEA